MRAGVCGMRFETVAAGFIVEGEANTATAAATGPRCAAISESEIVCTYMQMPRRGMNAFVPALSRSLDGGRTWVAHGPIWPLLKDRVAIHCSLSRSREGELFLFGAQTRIDIVGESDWNEGTHGLKENQLISARSLDGGRTWSDPGSI